jgi:hypothetical protein
MKRAHYLAENKIMCMYQNMYKKFRYKTPIGKSLNVQEKRKLSSTNKSYSPN